MINKRMSLRSRGNHSHTSSYSGPAGAIAVNQTKLAKDINSNTLYAKPIKARHSLKNRKGKIVCLTIHNPSLTESTQPRVQQSVI
jgi:hypothetical protein